MHLAHNCIARYGEGWERGAAVAMTHGTSPSTAKRKKIHHLQQTVLPRGSLPRFARLIGWLPGLHCVHTHAGVTVKRARSGSIERQFPSAFRRRFIPQVAQTRDPAQGFFLFKWRDGSIFSMPFLSRKAGSAKQPGELFV